MKIAKKLLPKKKKEKNTKLVDVEKQIKKNSTNEEPNYQFDTKPTMWEIISPDGMKIDAEDYGKIKQSLGTTTYFRPLYIPRDGYPRKLGTNWMYNLTSSGEIDIFVDVHKVAKSDAVRTLQRQITMLESNLGFQTKRGNIDQINDITSKIQDTNQLMSEVQFSENDMYNVATLATVYGQSQKEMDRYSEAIEDEMSSMFFTLTSTWGRVKKGFRSILPFGKVEIHDAYRNIDRRALSTFSPFISGSGKYMGGVPIGINKITGQLVFYLNSFHPIVTLSFG
jgi:hypothetical protein